MNQSEHAKDKPLEQELSAFSFRREAIRAAVSDRI